MSKSLSVSVEFDAAKEEKRVSMKRAFEKRSFHVGRIPVNLPVKDHQTFIIISRVTQHFGFSGFRILMRGLVSSNFRVEVAAPASNGDGCENSLNSISDCRWFQTIGEKKKKS